MKNIIITYTDGEVITEGPYSKSVAEQYSYDWRMQKRSSRSGIKSVRVVDAK